MNFRVKSLTLIRTIATLALLLSAAAVHAQTSSYSCNLPTATTTSSSSSSSTVTVAEDFTCNTTVNQWFFYNGACLTAGNNTSTTSPGYLPSCQSVLSTYYNVADSVSQKQADPWLAGGYRGFLGDSSIPTGTQHADPIINSVGHGALRFTNADGNNTNGHYGYHENGAVVSNFTFPTTDGIQITFKTATYYGDGGGAGGDGADGISFYLLDACMPLSGATVPSSCNNSTGAYSSGTFPGIGAWGGSLAYTCSNVNSPFDGLVGAYLGLGIDEYGNFLNGSSNTLGETDSTNPGADNTASGGLYKPGRIGLRGPGAISWQALNNAYGSSSGSSNPYYPASMATSCQSGNWNGSLNACFQSCPANSGYTASTNTCYTCSSGTYVSNSQGGTCAVCTTNYAYDSGTDSNAGKCVKQSGSGPSAVNPTFGNPTTSNPGAGKTYAQAAVQNTCATGNLFNYTNFSTTSPTSVGAANLSNTANTAKILDYPAISWAVLSGVSIANESSPYREGNPAGCTVAAGNCNLGGTPATPITYSLKITADGYLSLKYSVNGSAYNTIINSQNFSSSIGAIPANLRFGFAGSDGGASNIHEIMCFKATPAQSANTSGSVTVYQNPTVKTGAQIFTAFYNPSDWSGQLEAQQILFDTTLNQLVVQSAANWDGSCVLTPSTTTTPIPPWCSSTASTEAPASRQIFTWNDSATAPAAATFEWGSLNTSQQTALGSQSVFNYLRGDRSNENTALNSSGTLRFRTTVLGDIVDSSPAWVGPPQTYTNVTSWVDNLNTGTTQPEAASTAQAYSDFATIPSSASTTQFGGRQNVVYVGADDGFLHGFRAGSLDSNGNLVANSTTPNDGYEVMAYMPATVVKTIHNATSSALDFPNPLYSHNWYVDASPATGDLFYNAKWHTWLVGGLGAGGSAIYALNITDPSKFSESPSANAAAVVIGEWNSSNLTCAAPAGSCGSHLGNTYGTPEIRRFHSGDWGAIIGNGIGSSSGTAGIFIMLVNHTTGTPAFYYLPSGSTATGNGIVEGGSLDIDSDHVVDYIYAGDLKGNVWRWDVTSSTPSTWTTTTPFKLFTTPQGAAQPITTRVVPGTLKTVSSVVTLAGQVLSTGPERVIVNFGTGQLTPQTNTTPTTYATGQQYLFGIWDWNMGVAATSTTTGSGWNGLTGATQQAISLSTGPTSISISTNLQSQTISTTAAATSSQVATRSVTQNSVCYDTSTGCTSQQYGWYAPLPGTNEQIIYDPVISPDGELVVNTVIPVSDSPLTCTAASTTGFSMGMQPDTGGGSVTPFFTVFSNGNAQVDGVQLNGTGTPSFLTSGQKGDNNAEYMLTQTNSGAANPMKTNHHAIVNGQRLNWIQRR